MGAATPRWSHTSAPILFAARTHLNDLWVRRTGRTQEFWTREVPGKKLRDEHFSIGVPYARAINPVTKTDWEGTGVEPDVKASASEALSVALKVIADRRAANGSSRSEFGATRPPRAVSPNDQLVVRTAVR